MAYKAPGRGGFLPFLASLTGPIRCEMPDKMPARRPLLGDVAQWLEHLPCTQGVVGSSPIVSTTKGQFRWHTADSEIEAQQRRARCVRYQRRRQDKTHLQLLHSKRIKLHHCHHVTLSTWRRGSRHEKPDPREGVRRFASDHPTGAPVLAVSCEIARERGELPFRGQAFYDRAPEGVPLPSNLRTLVTYNILEKGWLHPPMRRAPTTR